ncbi:MAG: RnfABCDGE type electron transport complex subunit B [Oscillospiraceae bacterium]
MNILYAVLVLTGIGFLAAIGLVVASKIMFVPTNENVEKVRGVLPGANCGACGFAGCDDYAAAVAKGSAETNLCVPGADKTASAVAGIMGQKALDVIEKTAVVACKGCTDKTPRFEYTGVKTCAAANMLHRGPLGCTYGCEGLGDCFAACPFDAICVKNGVAHIDADICTGCAKCVAACPKKLIHLVPKIKNSAVLCSNKDKGAVTRKICGNGCIGCMKCEKICEHDAIHVENNCAAIDTTKCVQCKKCEAECPVGVIRIGKFEAAKKTVRVLSKKGENSEDSINKQP